MKPELAIIVCVIFYLGGFITYPTVESLNKGNGIQAGLVLLAIIFGLLFILLTAI